MATTVANDENGPPLPDEKHTPEDAARRGRRTRRKGPIRRRHWPIVALLAVISFLWLLPVFVAHTPIIDAAVRKALSDLNGTVRVRSASLGWFSPIVLHGLEIRGPDDQPLLEAAEAQGEVSLLGMLWDPARLGRFRLREPKLSLVLRDDGSNLEDALAEYFASKEPSSPLDIALELTDGTALVEHPATDRTWQIENLHFAICIPLDKSRPVEMRASGLTAGAQDRGQFEAVLKLSRGQGVPAQPVPAAGHDSQAQPGSDQALLKTQNLPLGMLEPLVRRWVPGARLDGRLDCSLEARRDGGAPGRATLVQGWLSGQGVQAALAALKADRPRLEQLRASGKAVWHEGLLSCDRLAIESDTGRLALNGTLDLRSGSIGGMLAAAPAQTWELKGQLDLARLAAILPNTLRIRKGTQITSGQVELDLSSRRSAEGMVWRGQLQTTNLTAVRDGRTLLWQQPIQITLAARNTRQGPVIDTLKCQSNFLIASVSGTRDQLGGSASFDLSKLADQTAGFLDLGGLRVTGDGWANFNWTRSERGQFEATLNLAIDRFHWGLPGRPVWAEDRFAARLSATGRTDLAGTHRVDTALLTLEAWPDHWEFRLTEPVVDFHLGPTWTVEASGSGQLARWQPRLGTWLAAHQWTLGGDYELLGVLSFSGDQIAARQTRLNIQQLVLEHPSWRIREPRVELTADGRLDRSARRLELHSALLKSSALAAQASGLVAAFPPEAPPELSGTILVDAALDRLQQWKLANAAASSWHISGMVSARADFQYSGGPIFARFQSVLSNLLVAHRSGHRFQEPEVRLAARGSYNHLSRSFVIEQAELASSTLAGSASGRLLTASPRPELQLAGTVDYDLERASQLFRSRYGDGVWLSGRGSSPFAYRGPWGSQQAAGSAGFAWDWADLYGFQVGPGQVQVSLARGALEIHPLNLSVNEGRVQLAPRIQISPGPAKLALGTGRVAQQVRLTPVTCAYALQYIAPVLAGVAAAEGHFSIDLEGCEIPLADPAAGELAGWLTIHSAQVGPGSLVRELAAVLGRSAPVQLVRQSVVPFRMTDRRIYHRDLELRFGELSVRTHGSVGLDQTLAMVAEISIPAQWQSAGLVGAALKDQALQLPITGTLRQPKIDRSALDQLNRQFLQQAARSVIQQQLTPVRSAIEQQLHQKLNEGLERLLSPPPKR